MGMYVCVYLYMYVGVHVCVGLLGRVFSIHLYLLVCVGCMLQYFGFVQWDLNPASGDPDPIWIRVVVNPTHRRFEDRFIGWSVDQCQFMQWRPDGDSVPKPRHFMWVFILMPISSLSLLCIIRIILCDFLLYFTSLTCCITSWDIMDCSPYLCNWYERVSVLVCVTVVRRCWLRPSIDTP